jgi:tyrosinase
MENLLSGTFPLVWTSKSSLIYIAPSLTIFCRFCLDGSFIVYFFLGDFDENHGTWLHEPNLVGSSGIFATPRAAIEEGHCSRCASNEQTAGKYYDSVGLTQGLLTYWKSGKEANGLRVTSLDKEVIIPFLTRNLHWRVVNVSIYARF